jgi:hypothetical protein
VRAKVIVTASKHESFSTTCSFSQVKVEKEKKLRSDPRINLLGRAIEDDFATIRENYGIEPSCPFSHSYAWNDHPELIY